MVVVAAETVGAGGRRRDARVCSKPLQILFQEAAHSSTGALISASLLRTAYKSIGARTRLSVQVKLSSKMTLLSNNTISCILTYVAHLAGNSEINDRTISIKVSEFLMLTRLPQAAPESATSSRVTSAALPCLGSSSALDSHSAVVQAEVRGREGGVSDETADRKDTSDAATDTH